MPLPRRCHHAPKSFCFAVLQYWCTLASNCHFMSICLVSACPDPPSLLRLLVFKCLSESCPSVSLDLSISRRSVSASSPCLQVSLRIMFISLHQCPPVSLDLPFHVHLSSLCVARRSVSASSPCLQVSLRIPRLVADSAPSSGPSTLCEGITQHMSRSPFRATWSKISNCLM